MINTDVVSSEIPALPNVVLEHIIFANLSLPELGVCSRVCKVWKELAKEHISTFSHPHAFGPKEWHTYCGAYLRNVPRLPSNVAEMLNSPCPFSPDKKVYETHLLVLIPETVNGQPLNLKLLGDIVQKPLQGNATKYEYFSLGEYTDPPAVLSHWVLMTRDVIEGSCNKSYQDQQALLEKQVVYEVPHILDATVCIFMEYIRTGTRIYSNSLTSCQEKFNAIWQLAIGGFGPTGLGVFNPCICSQYHGVGGSRKFEAIVTLNQGPLPKSTLFFFYPLLFNF